MLRSSEALVVMLYNNVGQFITIYQTGKSPSNLSSFIKLLLYRFYRKSMYIINFHWKCHTNRASESSNYILVDWCHFDL